MQDNKCILLHKYRWVGNDSGIGRYTFVGHRGSSVVDYVLGSQEMFDFVKSFEVQEPNILSDHCLVNFPQTHFTLQMKMLYFLTKDM